MVQQMAWASPPSKAEVCTFTPVSSPALWRVALDGLRHLTDMEMGEVARLHGHGKGAGFTRAAQVAHTQSPSSHRAVHDAGLNPLMGPLNTL